MSWPRATREDHARFCRVEGWRLVRDARGRTGTHHVTYELDLPDGRVLCTRVSHPVDRTDYGKSLWDHILRDQLEVSEAQLWACVRDDDLPDRGVQPIPAEALPAELVYLLTSRVGLTESDVAAMDKNEAVARLNRYWAEGV
ncbi:MAG: cytotoxic translational repressor of toxin-antitoxin stability system [Pseudonocardiaceae bacterium]|nr:cytotoxic translational repressor of toxin-antitoxin stability system [Pseudonocardiaceae bacterium]